MVTDFGIPKGPMPVATSSGPSAPSDTTRLSEALAQHFSLVWRSLRRFGIPASDVDDAAQQAFMTLADRLCDVAPGSERAFLLATAARLAANRRRKDARRSEVLTADLDERGGGAPNPEEAMLVKQRRELLDHGLEQLPLEQRTVFVLFELEGFSLPQIAQALAIPLGTATSRLRRAREKFAAWARTQNVAGGKP
jgi:RNA polymerase sigma-70 factor (ECF subfamily)